MNEEIIRTLIDEINAFMTSNLPDVLFEMVLRRLDSFGYNLTEEDAFGIAFSVQKSEINIMNDCNIEEVPVNLFQTLCDMACGDFLSTKYRTGKLDIAYQEMSYEFKVMKRMNVFSKGNLIFIENENGTHDYFAAAHYFLSGLRLIFERNQTKEKN